MKFGLLTEGKFPVDKRVVLTPVQCKILQETYCNVELFVQSSDSRCFADAEYIAAGVKVVDDISDCDFLFGIKEVSKELLIANKTYFYFSHTIKEQPYNRSLLAKMVEMDINMVDYEVLKNNKGKRLLGFGRYAGIVGAYNAFLAYGLKSGKYKLKPAYQCDDRAHMEEEFKRIILNKERIVITGNGRVGGGIMEIMRFSGIKEVSVNDFLTREFDFPVFVHLNTMDYNERIDGSFLDKYNFYAYPELYRSSFLKFAKRADIFIAGHYYAPGSPYLFTREDAKLDDFNLQVVADISCDIDGPVASTIRPSTIHKPLYGYDPITEQEVCFKDVGAIAVMAVSNLPCELPKDSSEDFGDNMLKKIFPQLINGDKEGVILKATICKDGDLMPDFEYLRDYINGN